MDKQQLTDFIRRTVPASEAALATITDQFALRTLRKHDFLLRQGTVSDEYFFLANGLLRAFTLTPAGNEVTTTFFTAPQVVFEVSSFFQRIPSAENIQALTDCAGFSVSYDRLNHIFHTVPEGREFGRMMLVQAFTAFKSRTLSLISETAEERYAHLTTHHRELLQQVPLKHIASYLGVTDSSLSRIRREFGRR